MSDFTCLRAGVIGTGFIGPVHVEALRRIGVQVSAICGGTRVAETARRWGIPHVFENYDAQGLIGCPDVDVVHVTSPNRHHRDQALAALAAGKHVVCEKPLAMNSRETAEIVAAARRAKRVFAVNYNVRFYAAVVQMRELVRRGALGRVIHVTGSYFQDWLLQATDYNWRLLAEEGGVLRAVGDIGTHWLDAASFILGAPIVEVFADLGALHAVRRRPTGEVRTFARETRGESVEYAVDTEDFAHLLLRFGDGARGSLAVSQVAAGRKNCLRIEIYGAEQSVWWNSENPEVLHFGRRDAANATAFRACAGFTDAAPLVDYPGGHVEGFPDTFKMLFRDVYSAIAAGGADADHRFATAADGDVEVRLCEAILRSHRERRWAAPDEA